MTTKYQIHGEDSLLGHDYVLPELYDTYDEAFARAHSNHEWVGKVEVIDLYAEGKRRFRFKLPA